MNPTDPQQEEIRALVQRLEYISRMGAIERFNRDDAGRAAQLLTDLANGQWVRREELVAENQRLREALQWQVNGFTLREYLEVQFPATIGHIPLQMFLDKFDKALRDTKPRP